jgi:hypothetical protein
MEPGCGADEVTARSAAPTPSEALALPVGIICLIVGLTTGSLVTWRSRWR